MDADKPKLSVNPTPDEATMAQVRRSADMDRRIAENDALNRIERGASEKTEAVWQGEGGSIASEQPEPLPALYPKLSGSWTPWGTQRS